MMKNKEIENTSTYKKTVSLNTETDVYSRTALLIRGLDLFVSGIGLFLLGPVFVFIGLAIKLTSLGPIFYKAERVGHKGKHFNVYKFRTMVVGADKQGPGVTVHNDSRVTEVGYILRRFKLDELPQLVNVFMGNMSLVGPRPEDPRYVALYNDQQRQVLSVRPGITSRASLHFRAEEALLDGEDWETVYSQQILPRKVMAEITYLQQRSLWTDIVLILQTVGSLFKPKVEFEWILKRRNRHILALDIMTLSITPIIALMLRSETISWNLPMSQALVFYIVVSLLIKLSIFYAFKLYDRYWLYAGVNDLARIVIASGLSMVATAVFCLGIHPVLENFGLIMYRTVPIIDGLLTGLAISASRFSLRGLYHWHTRRVATVGGRRVLIVGAGEAGAMVVREIRAKPQLDMEPIAFVDSDPLKIGTRIQSVPVLGEDKDIPCLVEQFQIQQIIVALPSLSLPRQQKIISLCQSTGVTTYNLPGIYELLAGYKQISRFPQVDFNHLLRREPIVIDQTEVRASLQGDTVLVTGAGGSIGRELCRQIASAQPARLILLGHGENSIFETGLDLKINYPELETHQIIVDVRDQRRVNWAVETFQPDVIYHAAAHKHVPFMQSSIEEAITNNVLGSWNVIRAAEQYDVKRFVLISTDKAINPTSIMGATKRTAEQLMLAAAQRSGHAYMGVRFGNVLGSRGSVVPIFQQQIATGGPLTITHPDMTRYFMTIPEASQLVLQASVLGQGGEIFVLDMGSPVRILDLATDLIELSGLKLGRDIKIVHSGVRSGEKLCEELFRTNEEAHRTKHHKIFMATDADAIDVWQFEQAVATLIELAQNMETQKATNHLRTIIPEYQPLSHQPSLQPVSTQDPAVSSILHPTPVTL